MLGAGCSRAKRRRAASAADPQRAGVLPGDQLLAVEATDLTPLATDAEIARFKGASGSLAQVRALATSLCAAEPRLRWLSACAPIMLSPDVALVGQDGWGDGLLGTPERSPVLLNDWRLIEELTGLYGAALRTRLRALGQQEAAALQPRLEAALLEHRTVLVVVHVPPFRDACWHEGRISDDDWLPWFTCHAVGEVLLAAAERHRDRSLAVLCGHTHGSGVAHVRPNLIVHTGAAEYGHPQLAGLWLAGNGALRLLSV